MATTVFPGAGVWPLKAGFKTKPGRGYVGFESDKTGAEKRRRVTTKAPGTLSFNLRLSWAQAADLMEHYEVTCKGGALRFAWTHPLTGADIEAQYTDEPDISERPNTAAFTGAVQLKYWPV